MLTKNIFTLFSLLVLSFSTLFSHNENWAIVDGNHQNLVSGKHLHLQQKDFSDPNNRTFYAIAQEKKNHKKPLIIAQVTTTDNSGKKTYFYYEATRFNHNFFGAKNALTLAEDISSRVYDPISKKEMHRITYFGLPVLPKKNGAISAETISVIDFSTVQNLMDNNAGHRTSIVKTLVIQQYYHADYMAEGIQSKL